MKNKIINNLPCTAGDSRGYTGERRHYEKDVAASVPRGAIESTAGDSRGYIGKRKHCGQAMVEMCICLIPILVVMLGMIFIAGLGISNIRAFIEAKGNAELASRSQNALGGSGDSIYCWNYGDTDNNEDGLPFTADDKIVSLYDVDSEYGTEALVTDQLNNSEYSQSEESNNYYFMPTSSLVSMDGNYETMLGAAELVEGSASSNFNNVFTLDSRTENVGDLKLTFTHLFGVEVDDLDLRNMRANKVYYPALPTEMSSGGDSGGSDLPILGGITVTYGE